MPLIVETGAVVAGADSYVSAGDYQIYGAHRGWELAGEDAIDEINLRRAFDALNRLWTYSGLPLDAAQEGAFPRSSVAGIPKRLKDAQCELAYLIQGGFDPFIPVDSKTSQNIKIGPISIGGATLPTGGGRIKQVEGLLRPLLGAGAGQLKVVRG